MPPDKNSEDFDPLLDGILFSRPYEWRLNLGSGIASEGYITSEDVAMDFPVINENFTGIINKYGYAQVVDSVATSKTGNVLSLLHSSIAFVDICFIPSCVLVLTLSLLQITWAHVIYYVFLLTYAHHLPKCLNMCSPW